MTGTPDARERNPDWTLAPAAHLREWIEDSGLSLSAFAVACAGRQRRDGALALIREVLDRTPLSEAHAELLARGTGVSARMWGRLEEQYRRDLAAGRTDTTPEGSPS